MLNSADSRLSRAKIRPLWLLLPLSALVLLLAAGSSADMPGKGAMPQPLTVDASERQDADDTQDSQDQNDQQDAQDDKNDESKVEPPLPQRVILFISRYESVQGVVELQDDEIIIVRDLQGKLHSHSKTRLQAIIPLVDPAPGGQLGSVIMRNNQRRDGIIHEDTFDHVLIEIEGIRTRLRRDLVSHVELQPTVLERYRRFKEQLQPGDIVRHLQLAQWLINHREWELAHTELLELLTHEQASEALRMLRVVEAQLELRKPAGDSSTGQPGSQSGAPRPPANSSGDRPANTSSRAQREEQSGPTRLLTDEEVNLIRVYEIDFNKPPRVQVRPDTITELIERYRTDPQVPATPEGRNAMYRADPLQIVRLMFMLRAREMYGKVQVITEPDSLQQFGRGVHDTWLVRNCATSECHGGPGAGRLQLHYRRSSTDAVRYTNLMILERLELDPDWPLINYDQPEMSLIIQHGLPQPIATLPHPDVKGWRPVFTRGNRETLDRSIHWINSMMRPRPLYPIEFDPNLPGAVQPDLPSDSDTSSRDPDR